jgi:hypothetical protein
MRRYPLARDGAGHKRFPRFIFGEISTHRVGTRARPVAAGRSLASLELRLSTSAADVRLPIPCDNKGKR